MIKKISLAAAITSAAIGLSACGGGSGEPENTVEKKREIKEATFKQTSNKVVASYYTSWSNYSGFTPTDIPAGDLTHILYAFLAPCPGDKPTYELSPALERLVEICAGKPLGQAVFDDPSAAFGYHTEDRHYEGDIALFKKLKEAHPHIRILPSFGGWSLSPPFHDLIKTEEARQRFVNSSVELIKKHEIFDGIDIDWEFPGGNGPTTADHKPEERLTDEEKQAEKEGFTLMMAEFRAALDELSNTTGRKYELSAAINGTPRITKGTDYANVTQYIDHYFVMTYDFFGAWNNDTGFHANLHDYGGFLNMGGDVIINHLIDLGVPSEKLVLGAHFAGRAWVGLPPSESDPNKPQLGEKTASGVMDDTWPMYKDIIEKYKEKNGFIYHYHEQAEAPYLYNPTNGAFITYENPRSIEAKGKWTVDQQLGGIFSWEIQADNGDLVRAMNLGVGNEPISNSN